MSVEPQPIRVVVGDDLERTRLTVAFRFFLAIPHLIWFVLFSGGVVFVVALAWVVALFRGSVPDSMHEFLAMYLRYATQLFAYLSFAADPYPGFIGTPGYPFDLEIEPPRPQSRLSIAFRLVIAFPALLIAAALTAAPSVGRRGESWSGGEDTTFHWSTAVGGVLWTVAFLAWFACLARGTMPLGFRNLNVYALRYAAEAWGYALLLTDRYPNADPRLPAEAGFPPDRPVRVSVDDDLSRSRLTVFFRLFLALPHLIWLALWGLLAFLVAIANWFATLVLGRSPVPLHRFLAAYIRYSAQRERVPPSHGEPLPRVHRRRVPAHGGDRRAGAAGPLDDGVPWVPRDPGLAGLELARGRPLRRGLPRLVLRARHRTDAVRPA